jgi:hypothetical protein
MGNYSATRIGRSVSEPRARCLLTSEIAEVSGDENDPARAANGMCFDSAKLLNARERASPQNARQRFVLHHESASFARQLRERDLLIELRFGAVLAARSLSAVALSGFDQPACVLKEQG